MSAQPVLIAGSWRQAQHTATFQADNPGTGKPLPESYPVSRWEDCDAVLAAASAAAEALRQVPPEQLAAFLTRFAERIDRRADELVEMAHAETALPKKPRLADVELPRTTSQLRQAAAASRERSWALPTIDTKLNIRSCHVALGPVAVFGPNNFPFAFNGVAGGDFAAAIAAGNPVIAKANSSHPGTTRLLAEEALHAVLESELPPAAIQMLYRTSHADGERLVADRRLGATGYTGSRSAGLVLKRSADAVGKPIYLELSSINPVVILPGALDERANNIAEEFSGSCLMGTGQFCTNPGMVLLLAGPKTDQFIGSVTTRFREAQVGTLLSAAVARTLAASVAALSKAGAEILVGGTAEPSGGYRFANTLLRVSGAQFLSAPEALQTEAFGNESLVVVARDAAEAARVLDHLEGNLTGCIYSDSRGSDNALYEELAPRLRVRVGRLLNDKMPTGVSVSPAMNHGGPYPATGHPGFTAVGIPASLRRFAMLACYDNVRPGRLPALLQDKNAAGRPWRLIDGAWTQNDIG
jgi:NADP-dependent aldehyde dehydrogenase